MRTLTAQNKRKMRKVFVRADSPGRYLFFELRLTVRTCVDIMRKDLSDLQEKKRECKEDGNLGKWYEEAVFYHMYPIGMSGAPRHNDEEEIVHRFLKLE